MKFTCCSPQLTTTLKQGEKRFRRDVTGSLNVTTRWSVFRFPALQCRKLTITPQNLLLGMINIVPRYRRADVNTHAMYFILAHWFDELNIVRIQNDAATFTRTSIDSALRVCFTYEGVLKSLLSVVSAHKRRPEQERNHSRDLRCSRMTDWHWYGGTKPRMLRMKRRHNSAASSQKSKLTVSLVRRFRRLRLQVAVCQPGHDTSAIAPLLGVCNLMKRRVYDQVEGCLSTLFPL